jgi:modulator of FtsH protease
MSAVVPGWESFFVAELGAAAALSGLLFVAVSINLPRILSIEHLPERAAETLVLLFSVLAVSTFGLVPGQSRELFGTELFIVGMTVWLVTLRIQIRAYADIETRRWLRLRVVGTQLSSIPFVAAGGLLASGNDLGIYAIVPGTIASFAWGVMNAWVLLVEIQR